MTEAQNTLPGPQTWEDWLHAVRAIVLSMAEKLNDGERAFLLASRLVYSAGPSGVFGATHHEAWKKGTGQIVPVLSVDALIQDDAAQLACTLIHEMGHILASYRAEGKPQGHGSAWKLACDDLGLKDAKAEVTGPDKWEDLSAGVSKIIQALALPLADGSSTRAYRWSKEGDVFEDGTPVPLGVLIGPDGHIRKYRCDDGVGSQGGVSSGKGAGSRYLLAECTTCQCQVRTTRKHAASLLSCAGTVAAPHDATLLVYVLASRPATMLKSSVVKADAPAPGATGSTADMIKGMRQKLIDAMGGGKPKAAKPDTSAANAPLLEVARPLWPIDLPLPPYLSLVPVDHTPQAVWQAHVMQFVETQKYSKPSRVHGKGKKAKAPKRQKRPETGGIYKGYDIVRSKRGPLVRWHVYDATGQRLTQIGLKSKAAARRFCSDRDLNRLGA